MDEDTHLRVLLIQSYLGSKDRAPPAFPLGLAYLSQALKEHECTVLDPNIEEHPFSAIEKTIRKTKPSIIGISLRNIDSASFSFLPYFEAMLKFIKKLCPDVKIVVGGTGFSLFSEEIMEKFPEIDYGVFLEGEYSFPALLKNLKHPQQVKGIYFRMGEKICFTGRSQPVDFDRLPEPTRDLPGIDLNCYRKYPFSIGVQTLRGCSFSCAYCTYPYLQGRTIRQRSPKKVVDEVEHLANLYGIDEVYFADPIFNFPFDHGRSICRELLSRKLHVKWAAYFREDSISKQFLIEARNSGCIRFEFSPDGASQDALDVLHKGTSIQDIKRTFELTNEIDGINANFSFFCNVPGENLKRIINLHRLLSWIKIKSIKKPTSIYLNNIRIYPNTRIHTIAKKEGLIDEGQSLLKPTFYNPHPYNFIYLPAKIALSPTFNIHRYVGAFSLPSKWSKTG
jgi:anaerobic magnesium-protoporphyrin IX monomethyl ester cyclase